MRILKTRNIKLDPPYNSCHSSRMCRRAGAADERKGAGYAIGDGECCRADVARTRVGGTHSESSATIGPGWSSTTPISNGRTTKLGPGEMQIIPPGTGHVWTEIADGGIVYMTIRVDPEHVLSLSK